MRNKLKLSALNGKPILVDLEVMRPAVIQPQADLGSHGSIVHLVTEGGYPIALNVNESADELLAKIDEAIGEDDLDVKEVSTGTGTGRAMTGTGT